jgi:GGDEF domain-containing protein
MPEGGRLGPARMGQRPDGIFVARMGGEEFLIALSDVKPTSPFLR